MLRVSSALFLLCLLIVETSAADKVKFNRDIRPIMSDTCFHCHGPDKSSRKAGLRLDIREEALKPAKSGGLPIVPGKPEQSEIITRIFTTDEDDLMPPDEAHKTLTPSQKETFKRWVAEGAEYEAHWAYTPLVRPAVPTIQNSKFNIQNSIDAFILAKLSEQKIEPSAAADKRTLLRRLSLDLTGLPPTTQEIDAFLADTSDRAYETQVDRLMKSPHYGERMAVWWLDVARFTDTVGFHGDQNQRIFPYRDYVIKAFNENKRFDQFTVEQLAGDLLPKPTTEQLVATGFNRLNMVTREGGAQPKEYLAKYGAERVRTVGGAWLGSTLGCSECHDHKFDPFTAKDFYTMQAYFADVQQWGVYADYGYTPNPELRGVNNDYPFFPEVEVESDYLKQRSAMHRKRMSALAGSTQTVFAKDASAKEDFVKWQETSREFLAKNPTGWISPKPQVRLEDMPPAKPAKDKKPEAKVPPPLVSPRVEADSRIVFVKQRLDKTIISVTPAEGWVSALRLELLPSSEHGESIVRNGSRERMTLKLSASLHEAGQEKSKALPFSHADADHKTITYASGAEIIGIKDQWKTDDAAWNQKHTAVCLLDQPVKLKAGDRIEFTIASNLASSVRLSVSPFAFPNVTDLTQWAGLESRFAAADDKTVADLRELYLLSTGWQADSFAGYKRELNSWLECRNGRTFSMITKPVAPLTVKVLPRGNWMDESGEVVTPASPEFLPSAFKPKEGQRLTRLELAKWLCSPENPLTPRAVVNRWWKMFYGNGLSSVVDDLGAQGELPSHLELLDWLSCEFRDSGWDVQHMIRLMVTSETYKQSSSLRPELRDLDPNNRLLASQNPRRLDAEFVRDNALAIAGVLNRDMGGPSVKPYQPPGYYENLQFPSRDYIAETDDRQWRRGVYMHWQRTYLHPMLANFDAPMRDECTASRPPSNTPQQALTLLNDPSFVEAARVFAAKLLEGKAMSDEARLDQAFTQALARPLQDKERTSLLYLLQSQRDHYKANMTDAEKLISVGIAPVAKDLPAAELASWTTLCRVILNLQETITRY
jgi:hypothetical protein